MPDLNLRNKNAIVCGSTKGIGKAVALELASLGANIILIARNESSLKTVVAELDHSQGQNHQYVCADFSKTNEVKEKITSFMKNNPPVHILVNNTGGPAGGAIADAALEAFEQTFAQHLLNNHILAQAVIPGMKAEKYGRIINIISTSVKQPIKGLGVSNTIRAAVASWAKTLAGELASFGITVNNVLPGATQTERLHDLVEAKAKNIGRSVEEISNDMLSEIPAKRFALAEEIAYAAAFLASPAAAYITGINLPVDGGRTGSL
jgi:3-oxoacyl-[acyl-carrier protein] reductase